jgi:hypothetical protein
MNPEIKDRWLRALRSGEYRQGRGRLKGTSTFDGSARYCCLGVLCELAVQDGVIPAPEETGPRSLYGSDGELTWSDLPTSVAAWAGLDDHDPAPATGRKLSDRNDDGWSFEDLANLIEKDF